MSLKASVWPVETLDTIGLRESVEKTGVVKRVAQSLDLDARRLSGLLRSTVWEAAIYLSGQGLIEVGTEQFRNALRVVRLSAALTALYDQDLQAQRQWLDTEDLDLGATPWAVMIHSEEGFEEVLDVVSGLAQARTLPAPH